MIREWVGLIITAVVLMSIFGAGCTVFWVYDFCANMEPPLIFAYFVAVLVGGKIAATQRSISPFLLMVSTGSLAVSTAILPVVSFWLYTGNPLYFWLCLLFFGSCISGNASLLGMWWFRVYADQRWMNRIQYRYSHTSLGVSMALTLLICLIFPSIGFVRMGFVWMPCFLFLMLVWMDIDERAPTLFVLIVAMILVVGWGSSLSFVSLSEEGAYPDSIIVRDKATVVTKDEEDIRLYRNGNLRFSSIDSYRYYETLVHVPSTGSQKPMRDVLVLGAEGGLLVQEVLKYETVTRVDVFEHFDTASLVHKTPVLRSLNHNVFDDKRVQIHDTTIFDFVRSQRYDAIFMDLPESGNRHTAQYYKRETFALLLQVLKEDGFLVTQAGSPFFSPFSFWEHVEIISSVDEQTFVYPYHTNVPSFGEWGFVTLSRREQKWDDISLPDDVRFLPDEMIPQLFFFSNDMRISQAG